jgi:hypothetical protein
MVSMAEYESSSPQLDLSQSLVTPAASARCSPWAVVLSRALTVARATFVVSANAVKRTAAHAASLGCLVAVCGLPVLLACCGSGKPATKSSTTPMPGGAVATVRSYVDALRAGHVDCGRKWLPASQSRCRALSRRLEHVMRRTRDEDLTYQSEEGPNASTRIVRVHSTVIAPTQKTIIDVAFSVVARGAVWRIGGTAMA